MVRCKSCGKELKKIRPRVWQCPKCKKKYKDTRKDSKEYREFRLRLVVTAFTITLIVTASMAVFRNYVRGASGSKPVETITIEKSSPIEMTTPKKKIDPFSSAIFDTEKERGGIIIEWINPSPKAVLQIRNTFPNHSIESHIEYFAKGNNGPYENGEEITIEARLDGSEEAQGYELSRNETTITCQAEVSYAKDIEQISSDDFERLYPQVEEETLNAISKIIREQSVNGYSPITLDESPVEDSGYGYFGGSVLTNINYNRAYLVSRKAGLDDYSNYMVLTFTCDKVGGDTNKKNNVSLINACSYAIIRGNGIILEKNGDMRIEPSMVELHMNELFTNEEYMDLYLFNKIQDKYQITSIPLDWSIS